MPSDILHDSPRVAAYVEADSEAARQDDLDILEEARDLALSRSAIYQQSLRRYHSRQVRGRVFNVGDLVLRLIQDKQGITSFPRHGKDRSSSAKYFTTAPTD